MFHLCHMSAVGQHNNVHIGEMTVGSVRATGIDQLIATSMDNKHGAHDPLRQPPGARLRRVSIAGQETP